MSACHILSLVIQLADEWNLTTLRAVHQPPTSTRPIPLDHGLKGYLQTPKSAAYKFTWSWPPSTSSNSLDQVCRVHFEVQSITVSKCIFSFAPLPPQHTSPNSLDYSLQVHTIMDSKCSSKLAGSQSWSASLSSVNNNLQLNLQICWIPASTCISKLAGSRPWSVSLSSLHFHFQMHLELLSSSACSQFQYTVCRCVAI